MLTPCQLDGPVESPGSRQLLLCLSALWFFSQEENATKRCEASITIGFPPGLYNHEHNGSYADGYSYCHLDSQSFAEQKRTD